MVEDRKHAAALQHVDERILGVEKLVERWQHLVRVGLGSEVGVRATVRIGVRVRVRAGLSVRVRVTVGLRVGVGVGVGVHLARALERGEPVAVLDGRVGAQADELACLVRVRVG